MLRLSLAGLALASILFSLDAHAEDPNLPVVETRRVWYGWQTLSCDAAAFTAFAIAGETASNDERKNVYFLNPGWAFTGASLFFLCGPIVHLAHGHDARMFGDLGLRIGMAGLPLLFFGAAANDASARGDGIAGSLDLFFGSFLAIGGAAAAVAIDATRMSRETKYVVVPRSQSTFTVTPDIESRRGGGTLGLRGTF